MSTEYYDLLAHNWFYNVDVNDFPPIRDRSNICKILLQRIADELFDKLLNELKVFAQNQRSAISPKLPTIWEQIKEDAWLNVPISNNNSLTEQCWKLLRNIPKTEIYLLWLLKTPHDKAPEKASMTNDITKSLTANLYLQARDEYQQKL